MTGETTRPAAAADPEHWQRLDRRMLVIHPVQELVRALPGLLMVLLLNRDGEHRPLWAFGATALVLLLGIARWATTGYRVTPRRIMVRRGVLRRSVVSVPRDRVRSVDLSAPPVHRLLGLTRITIGTGQSDRKGEGLRLDSLSHTAAAGLRDELLGRAREAPAAPATAPVTDPAGAPATAPAAPARAADPEGTVLADWRPGWLRMGPYGLSGVLIAGTLLTLALRTLTDSRIDPGRLPAVSAVVDAVDGLAVPVRVAVLALACLLAVAALSTVGHLLVFWRFRLVRTPTGVLQVSRGLVSRRVIAIDEARLRGVEISEPLLLRLAGGARCIGITTGLRVGRGAERGGSLLVPPAPVAEVLAAARALLSEPTAADGPLERPAPAARRRRYTRALGGWAVLSALVLWLAPEWARPLPAVLLPLALLLAADRVRGLGHALAGRTLVVRRGSLVRRRHALDGAGVIGWNLRRSPFQRRAGLVTLTATTAAGHQKLSAQDLTDRQAMAVVLGLSPELLEPFLVRPDAPEPAAGRPGPAPDPA
ncbi:PH domain-containing protein [Kitasatospora sp. NPDC056446]|uniref:PH domain-containing protein n=1 Tax=Kitasatospora sp. NPDC056446 TaxID=3345819 RepID=UPI00367C574B